MGRRWPDRGRDPWYARANYTLAQQVAGDDPGTRGEDITYPSPNGTGEITAYLVRPTENDAARPPAAVLVIHENRGLNPYIRDVVRRLAEERMVAWFRTYLAG